MSELTREVAASVDGFTPIFDSLTVNPELGIEGAAVFGRMWRYCQMRDGVCKASMRTIAGDIGLSLATVQRRVSKLVELGYLEDLTPDLVKAPHVYADTGKVRMKISIGEDSSVSQGNRFAQSVSGGNRTVSLRRSKRVQETEEREGGAKNETQHTPKRSNSLSAYTTITYREDEIPAHLRNKPRKVVKRKPFKSGQWKGYDPDPSSRHPNVKAYRRAFPFIKLERSESKALAAYKDTARLAEALAYWRKGVMGQLTGRPWSARNWRGIQETYDRIGLRPPAADVKQTQAVEQYQPVYN